MLPVFYEQRPESLFIGDICDHPFPAHVHDVTEIICLTAGRADMTIGGAKLSLKPGDVAIAFPSVPHSYDEVSEDAAGLSMIFAADAIAEFTHTFRTMQPASPLLPAKKVPEELRAIIRKLTSLSQQELLPLRLGYMHLFLSYLFTQLPLQPLSKSILSGLPQQVLHYVSEHFTEPLSLESTARALGVSRIHLSHIFSQQLNINFRQYINTLRIDRACALLRNPAYSVSQIIDLCGYQNPRTFHRAFLAQCGVPPKQYRTRLAGTFPEEPEESD